MHILFVHPNFPAQFGHIAEYLVRKYSFECTFASEKAGSETAGIRRIQFESKSGATASNHFCTRTFENQIWKSHALYETLAARREIKPDLIVGHTGFVSTLFLRDLYDCPVINYFEYFYRVKDSDIDFRHDLPRGGDLVKQRARTRNAILLLDLENCDAGYSPTNFQRNRLPEEFQPKIRSIFDGIDTDFWRPQTELPRQIMGIALPDDKKVITYVSRGMESMRGFDMFLRLATRVRDERQDVLFLVVGEDRVAYGGDQTFTGGKSFKDWVVAQNKYDLDRIGFLGRIPPSELAKLFSITDLHLYWTVPFVLSWSMMDALACGALVAGSDTAPVREMIQHEKNGLLFDFFDLEQQVDLVHRVLDDRPAFEPLAQSGLEMIREKYAMEVCLPQVLDLYQSVQ